MIKITKEWAIMAHEEEIRNSGGIHGIRDESLLESALAAPDMEFGGVSFFPTREEKAARLGYGIMTNHAFIDGNKRTGCKLMLMYLALNGVRIECSQQDVIDVGLGVSNDRMTYEDLLQWIHDHKI